MAPTSDITSHVINFAGATPVNPNLAAALSVNGIIFSNGAGSYGFIDTKVLTLGTGGIVNADDSLQTVGTPLELGAAAAFSPNSTGGLTISDSVNNGGFSLTLGGSGTGTGTISDIITGSGDLIVDASGGGTWILSGANRFTGNTIINRGTLKLGATGGGSNTPLGKSGNTASVTGTGAALDLNGFNLVTAEPLSLVGTGVNFAGALTNSGSAATYLGVVTLGTGGATIGGSGDITLSAPFAANSNDLTKAGTATLTLSEASTRTGNTTVEAGTLRLASPSAIGTTDQTLTLNGGTLALTTDSSVSAYNTTVSGNATVTSNRATSGAGITHTLGSLALGAQTLSIAAGTNVSSGTAGVTFGVTTLSGAARLNTAASTALTLSAVGETGGAQSLTKSGAGSLTFAGTNTITGGITLSAGTLTVNSGAVLASTSAPLIVNGGTLALNNAVQTVASLSGTGGTISFGSGHRLTVSQITDTSFSGAITSVDATGGLTKSGAGTLTLSGDLTFSGPTLIGAGTIQLGASNVLSSSSAMTLNGGTLALAGFSDTAGTLTIGTSGGTIDFGSGLPSVIAFADSSAQSWGGTLTITNFITGSGDSLRFGTSASGLTGGQLASITFDGFGSGASIDSSGFVSPIPEPGTYAALFGTAALLVAAYRRRVRPKSRIYS